MMFKFLAKHIKLLMSIVLVLGSVLYRNELKFYYDFLTIFKNQKEGVYSINELGNFNGINHEKLYLAVLGIVFDVTEGKKHYSTDGAYHYFVGKDGSRALVTGDFKDESENKDHVMDLPCNDLFTLQHWRNTFKQRYIKKGVVIGRYYDKDGEKTSYSKELDKKIKQCEIEKENSKKEDQKYPPCNIAWSADEGTKVWCTKSSGGVIRSWAGVPRQLYTPGVDKPRCVCLNTQEQDDSQGLIKEYDNCHHTSHTCLVNNN